VALGGGATLRVLGPTDRALGTGADNDASLVLRLSMGEVTFLLTGDIEAGGEDALLAAYGGELRAQVLKLAHHGSGTSSSEAFLRAVEPSIAVVSAGAGNPFGHPSAEVVQRLAEALVLRTDERGDITLSTDGRRLWVDVSR